MNKDILLVVDAVSNEKGVEKDVIFEALEAALASATRKKHGGDIDVRVDIDRETGDYATFRRWEVLADDSEQEFPLRQMCLTAAREDQSDVAVGDFVEDLIESVEFGRIAAQTAKQVIVQKVREAERARVVQAYEGRVGELVMGIVKRSERNGVYLDLGGHAEAFIARDEMIPREAVRVGDRLRGYLREVRFEPRGPQLFVSRTSPGFLIELFKLEVPEVGQGLIEIMGAARDPGMRAKIAVRSHDPRLDPIGACVGMRGSRVQTVSNELAGERVDIILWDDNLAQFVVNAMSPASVVAIVVEEDSHSIEVAVEEDQLSLAIGRNGQNVRLASELIGWELNVMDAAAAEAKNEQEAKNFQQMFINDLDVDGEIANILVQEGFTSIEEVAYVPEQELLDIDEFDADMVKELRNRARDYLLTKAIASEEHSSDDQPSAELLALDGMTAAIAQELSVRGINSLEDLAEQAVDDLLETECIDADLAARLIMQAREPWFSATAGESSES